MENINIGWIVVWGKTREKAAFERKQYAVAFAKDLFQRGHDPEIWDDSKLHYIDKEWEL